MATTKLVTRLTNEQLLSLDDVSKLREEYLNCAGDFVGSIIRLSIIVRRLEELGDDLSDMEISILPELRRVAYGQVAPELLVNLQGKSQLLRRVSNLPMPEQRKIASGEPIMVLDAGGDHRMVPPLNLTSREIKQVFGDGCIRDEADQSTWIRKESQKKPRAKSLDDVTLDRKRRGIVVRDRFISATELSGYLSQLANKM